MAPTRMYLARSDLCFPTRFRTRRYSKGLDRDSRATSPPFGVGVWRWFDAPGSCAARRRRGWLAANNRSGAHAGCMGAISRSLGRAGRQALALVRCWTPSRHYCRRLSQTTSQKISIYLKAGFQDLGENQPKEHPLTPPADNPSIECQADIRLTTPPAYICRLRARTPGTASYDCDSNLASSSTSANRTTYPSTGRRPGVFPPTP